jgi:flagellar biosynthetic protein FlhB
MADAQGEKTEKPTAKKLRDARKKGQVARSRDLGVALASLATTTMLAFTGAGAVHRLGQWVADALTHLDRSARREMSPEVLTGLVMTGGSLLLFLVAPIMVVSAGTGVLTAVAQGGFNFAPEALHFKWERLSLKRGFSKLAPSRAGLDTLKTLLTVTVMAFIAWRIGVAFSSEAPRLAWSSAAGTAEYGWQSVLRLLWQTSLALAAVGAADYGLQRWRLTSSLKMTRQEVRDEARSNEGSPEIKARVRRIQRDMVKKRMLHATAKATVVITNPTHFAVALEYNRAKAPAPRVVAKGRDLVAARMREIARANSVPIVENPPLARALFKGAEVGDIIPSPLFGAVAEVLAYLIRIKQLML